MAKRGEVRGGQRNLASFTFLSRLAAREVQGALLSSNPFWNKQVLEKKSHILCLGNPGSSTWAPRGSVTVLWEWLSPPGANQGARAKTLSLLEKAAENGVSEPAHPPHPLTSTPSPQAGRGAGSLSPDSKGMSSHSFVWEGGEKPRPPGGEGGRERRGKKKGRGRGVEGEMES